MKLLSLIYITFSEKLSLKSSKPHKERMPLLMFLPLSNFAVFGGCYFLCY